MKTKSIIVLTSVILSVVLPSQAFACTFAALVTEAERIAAANAAVSRASVIMEAEVVRAYKSPKKPALLRAIIVAKGPKGKKHFLVTGGSSCDIEFTEVGSRQRVLLFGGPKVYRASLYASSSEDIDRAIADMPKHKHRCTVNSAKPLGGGRKAAPI
jgi:hypothetical protein